MTSNQIAYWTLEETKRANLAKERENNRTNLANEEIRRQTNQINQSIGYGNLSETRRANLAKETELNRHQVRTENQKDVDQAIESAKTAILQQNADTNSYNALINERNAATNAGMLAESQRTNYANEQIKQGNLEELSRHNLQDENIRRFVNATGYATNANQAQASLTNASVNQQNADTRFAEYQETRRKNLVDQYLRSLSLQHEIENDAAKLQQGYIQNMKPNVSYRVGGSSR